MKTLKNFRLYFVLLSILSSGFLLSSCLKGSDPQPGAALSVVNAATVTPSVDLYIDGYLYNRDPIPTSAFLAYNAISPVYHDLDITRGNQINIMIPGGANFESGKYFSLYITNKSALNDSLAAVFIDDDLSDPPAGKAKLRFANLAPDAPAADTGIQGGAVLASNVSSFKISPFAAVDPGTFTIDIRPAGTTTSKASKASVALEAGKIYTVLSIGNWSSPDYKVDIIVHNGAPE